MNKDENYDVDKNPNNEQPEDHETFKDKIVDKFKKITTIVVKFINNVLKGESHNYLSDFRLFHC